MTNAQVMMHEVIRSLDPDFAAASVLLAWQRAGLAKHVVGRPAVPTTTLTDTSGRAQGPMDAMKDAMKEAQRKRKRETKDETKSWKWLLWESAFATEYLQPELGAGWTAVLKEACCVRAGVHKTRVERLRKESDGDHLRLWKKDFSWRQLHFEDIVVTVPLLEWCVAREYEPSAKTFEATARGGNWDAIRWLLEHTCPWDGLQTSKGRHAQCAQPERHNACAGAARGGHLDLLKWLHDEGCPWDEGTCANAARGGHLDVLKWLHDEGCPWDEGTCANAARGGHLDVLKYARHEGCMWDEVTCQMAAGGGHLDVLKYAHENGCPWEEMTCMGAAIGGHLDELKYVHEEGCPWSEATCYMAAKGGHLDVLKYAREHGCPWSMRECLDVALHSGHQGVIAWISEQSEEARVHLMSRFQMY